MFFDAKQLSFVTTFLGLVAQWIEQQISNLSVKSSNLFKFTIGVSLIPVSNLELLTQQ